MALPSAKLGCMQAVELFLSMQMANMDPSRQVLLALFEVFEATSRPASAAHLLSSCQVRPAASRLHGPSLDLGPLGS